MLHQFHQPFQPDERGYADHGHCEEWRLRQVASITHKKHLTYQDD
jgi:hypothetical protein